MTTDSQACELLISRNSANGQELGRFSWTLPEAVAEIVVQASLAQKTGQPCPGKCVNLLSNAGGPCLAREAEAWAVARLARLVAHRLEVGPVAIHESVTNPAHVPAPFGGCKSSSYGRIRRVSGLRELAQSRVVQTRKPGGFRPHLFPYDPLMLKIFAGYRRIFYPRG